MGNLTEHCSSSPSFNYDRDGEKVKEKAYCYSFGERRGPAYSARIVRGRWKKGKLCTEGTFQQEKKEGRTPPGISEKGSAGISFTCVGGKITRPSPSREKR